MHCTPINYAKKNPQHSHSMTLRGLYNIFLPTSTLLIGEWMLDNFTTIC